ncbi:MAG: thioredoxin family protein [Chitinophagaceae bacterium]|nr:MAG: thioredoxin family protein [Chitinophagaceae bacterium]
MKTILTGILSLFLVFSVSAQTQHLDSALAQARTSHRQVLLRFSGSDWCIPCIRMEKELFSNADFHHYADSNLVLLAADFPRLKKHRLSPELQAENDRLAERYNPQGSFPLILLLDEKGTVLRRWEGSVEAKPSAFVDQLSKLKGS